MEATLNITELASSLGLKPSAGDMLIGKLRGFPVGLKIIDPLGSALLLFQVRHPLASTAEELRSVHFEDQVSQLIADKKLKVEYEDKLVWVTFIDGAKLLREGVVAGLLDSVLSSFMAAGLARNAETCHYCLRERVEMLNCIDEKVVQICPACLAERTNAPAHRPAEASEGVLPIAFLAPLAAFVGGLGWALFWVSYDLLFEFLGTESIAVPRIIELIALVGVAFVTGGPVGFVIKRIQRRGQSLSVMFAIASTLMAIVVGEVAYVAWLIYRQFKVVSPSAAWNILPKLEMEMGGFHLLIKLGAAICSIVLAVEMARPPKPKMAL